MILKTSLRPFPEMICYNQHRLRKWADIATMLHLFAFIVALVMGVVSDSLWLVASILIGGLMIMVPFVTEAVIESAESVTR